jgi:predicted patatin/cPLA2 family phospholipase
MPKRALILAGGGMKVGFQAGVLEVWLDEAGITFDHADGASGGCFNLAMYCQGMTGRQIADNWRRLDPFMPVDLNWQHYWRLAHAPSLFTYDNFRSKVLPFWGVDWQKIRASSKLGTFNMLNFSKKQLETVTNDRMTEDRLIAAVSLPMWFPPVVIEGQSYIDGVYITDANVEEAIRRGADEIWAIWTVSTKDEWRGGFVAQYFHIIEAIADTHFFGIWKRIEQSNAAIAAGGQGEFGRTIELKLLQAEVPVHYLFNFSRDRMAEAVNLGVTTARKWCQENNVQLVKDGVQYVTETPQPPTALRFTEEMKGHAAKGATDPAEGEKQGQQANTKLEFKLTIEMADLDLFITHPDHEAKAKGWIESPLFGGRRDVNEGTVNLFVHDNDPAHKQMRYRLFFTDQAGQKLTLTGVKEIHDDGRMEIWADTTTLFVRIWSGHVAGEPGGTPVAAGIVHIKWYDFLQQLTTFEVEARNLGERIAALNRFGLFFFGKIWDVFLRQFVDFGPI